MHISRFLRRWAGAPYYPVVAMFADVRTKSKRTDLADVLRQLRRFRLKNAMPDAIAGGLSR